MKRGLLIDLDGVLYQGDRIITGAIETMNWLQEQGVPYRFITNTTSRPRRMVVEKLQHFGIKTCEDWILTPSIVARKWLLENAPGPVALFVPEVTHEDFNGIPVFDQATNFLAAVVVGDFGEAWTFDTLNRAFTLLMKDSKPALIALGMTRYWRSNSGLRLDAGPFIKALEYAASCRAIVVGKPSGLFFQIALQSIGCEACDAVMIGDDIVGDVHGAQLCGLRGILVRTGKFRPADLKGEIIPHAVLDSIADLPDWWAK